MNGLTASREPGALPKSTTIYGRGDTPRGSMENASHEMFMPQPRMSVSKSWQS